jgi:hypothetical protein
LPPDYHSAPNTTALLLIVVVICSDACVTHATRKLFRAFHDQTLTVSFIKPWHSLAEMSASSFADNEFTQVSEKWWALLDIVRTHFEENPLT